MSVANFESLHDSLLSKIELGENNVKLQFKLTNGVCVVVELVGVNRLLCNSVKEGNIVLEVSIVERSSDWHFYLDKLFELNEDNGGDVEPRYLANIVNKLNKKELVIFHISPTYGCELIALCERVSYL